MSKASTELQPLFADKAEISFAGGTVRLAGVISMRSPSEIVTPYLRRVHELALAEGLGHVNVDLADLTFMNSSSIRSLVDWVEWIRREPVARRYVLHFVPRKDASWQKTTLSAIQCFGGAHVVVEQSA